jgi:hypothetical protein
VASLQEDASKAKSGAGNYSAPNGFTAGYDGSTLWVAGGTSNILIKMNLVTLPTGVIENEKQMIFGFKVPAGNAAPYVRGTDFKNLPEGGKLEAADNKPGWYIPLRPGGTEGDMDSDDEYVSTKPAAVEATMYVATFQRRKKIDKEETNPCALTRLVRGNSRIFAIDIRTGGSAGFKDENGNAVAYIELEDIKITDIAVTQTGANDGDSSLVITYDLLSDENNLNSGTVVNNGIQEIEGVQALKLNIKGGTGNSELEPGSSVINYWLAR